MPTPTHCPNPACTAHTTPPDNWLRPCGFYATKAHGYPVAGSLAEAWKAEVVTPPIRWVKGQKGQDGEEDRDGTTVRVPRYTLRDLARAA
ncbi:MAG: hypothetical protein ACLFR8_05310 [Alkalispirochaeta sp.]